MAFELVSSRNVAGATSSAVKAIYNIPSASSISAYPSAAGTATVYVSTSPVANCQVDVAAGNITSANTAQWSAWSSGAVTALTSEVAYGALTAVAVKPASGTWVLEVASDIVNTRVSTYE